MPKAVNSRNLHSNAVKPSDSSLNVSLEIESPGPSRVFQATNLQFRGSSRALCDNRQGLTLPVFRPVFRPSTTPPGAGSGRSPRPWRSTPIRSSTSARAISPHLNVIERFWRVLWLRAMHNRLFDHLAARRPSVRNSLRDLQTARGPVAECETRPANRKASGVWCLTLRLLLRIGRRNSSDLTPRLLLRIGRLSRGRRGHRQLLGLRSRSHGHLSQR